MKDARYQRLYIVRLHFYEMPRIGKCTETANGLVIARAWGVRKGKVTTKGYEISFGSDENTLELFNRYGSTTL